MGDKQRTTAPITTRFSAGELADPTKFDGAFLQASRAFAILEYAIGDTRNSGGDAFLESLDISDVALMIPNIARYLGITALINPRIPNTSSVTEYTHKALSSDAGKHEMQLSLPPTSGTSFTISGTGAPAGAGVRATLDLVNASGEWYVDRNTGWCYFYDTIAADWKLTYAPTVESEMGDNATANVIPDPNTHASWGFQGCKIAYTNNTDNSQGYIIFLPPRGPLSATRRVDRSPQSEFDASSNTDNVSTSPGSTPVKLWQDDSVAATTGTYAEHYRYVLPKLLTDNWAAASALPTGFLQLFDPSQTKTTIDGVTFAAENSPIPRKYVLIVSGDAVDSWVTNYMNTVYAGCGGTAALTQRDTHTAAYYPSGGLRVITIGNALSAAVGKLTASFMDHDHGSANSHPGKPVSHSKLTDCFTPGSTVPYIVPSELDNDPHPQYLHRKGTNELGRDRWRGGMLGDIFCCSWNDTSDYSNLNNDSHGIKFGHPTAGPYVHFDYADDALNVDNSDFNVSNGKARHNPGWTYIFCNMTAGVNSTGTWTWEGIDHTVFDEPPHWKSSAPGAIFFEIDDWPEGCMILQVDIWCYPGAANILFDGEIKVWNTNAVNNGGTPQWTGMTSIGPQVSTTTGGVSPTVEVVSFIPTTYISHLWTHGLTSGNGEKLIIKANAGAAGADVYGIRLLVSHRAVDKWAV